MPDGERDAAQVEHLRKIYESATGNVEAIGDISFTMDAGELVCIVGPSGCGKTTLLKCIAGLLRPTAGVVELDGETVTPSPTMALVFQEYGRSLYPWLTVRGNVELPLEHKSARAQTGATGRRRAGCGRPGARREELSLAAVGRHAAARGDRPRDRLSARSTDHGRTVRRRRRPDPGRPGGPGPECTASQHVDPVRHPRHRRVRVSGRTGGRALHVADVGTGGPRDRPAAERDQITTRALPRFTELRTHVYEQIQRAKRGEAVRPRVTGGPDPADGAEGMRSRQPKQLLLAFFGEHVVDGRPRSGRAS